MAGYQPITDIAGADSAIAELYGKADALISRMSDILGESSTTAYRGDRGKVAYDHSQTTGNPHGLTLIALGGAPLASPAFTGNPTLPASTLFMKEDAGYEGGQFFLQKATSGTLAGNTKIDMHGNTLRIFENGGSWRGVSIDLSTCPDVTSSPLMHANVTYPVGSTLTMRGVSTNPSTLLGFGTWTQRNADYERICVGSMVIHDGLSGSGNVAKTELVGCYNYLLIDGVFKGITIPSGYHKEWRLSAQFSTGNTGSLKLYINTIPTEAGGTFSGPNFRSAISSSLFKAADFNLIVPVIGYYGDYGASLFYETSGMGGTWQFWNATITGFLTSDDIHYEWKRTT